MRGGGWQRARLEERAAEARRELAVVEACVREDPTVFAGWREIEEELLHESSELERSLPGAKRVEGGLH